VRVGVLTVVCMMILTSRIWRDIISEESAASIFRVEE
jgi:hypothetical protein